MYLYVNSIQSKASILVITLITSAQHNIYAFHFAHSYLVLSDIRFLVQALPLPTSFPFVSTFDVDLTSIAMLLFSVSLRFREPTVTKTISIGPFKYFRIYQ